MTKSLYQNEPNPPPKKEKTLFDLICFGKPAHPSKVVAVTWQEILFADGTVMPHPNFQKDSHT